MRVDEYLTYDATGLAQLIAAKEVTATEVLAAARERAAAVNPRINAIVADIPEADEQAADEALSGPFAGVPFLVKDLAQEYAGHPTTYGSRSLVDDVAEEHSYFTRSALDAGLVIFGKTNTPELGSKGITEPELFGPARNPWNTDHTPGGSSGGSGAAVAAGIVPVAGANDGGGSIRIPAACNGLVGLKTTRGLLPLGPHSLDPSNGFVVQGVVTRTVRDAAGLYDALAGDQPLAMLHAPRPETAFAEAVATSPRKLRIGFTSASSITAPDPEAIAAVEQAAAALEALGHEVEEVEAPYDAAELGRDFLSIWFASAAANVAEVKRRTGAKDTDFEADTLAVAELGRAGGVVAVELAHMNRRNHVRRLSEFHAAYDLLLTPTLAKPPLRVGEVTTPKALQTAARLLYKLRGGRVMRATGLIDQLVDENLGWVPYTQLANLTGRPAISVPTYRTGAGLPLGVQLSGQLGDDGLLLQVAAQLEQATPWAEHRALL
ncbi:Asp-tRNA(Asn)/Glu-tRNA(Gln) amidotransferase A subunit family amidase [Nocardioides albertanoniae]|uniref:Asp-tRNA(Asn)/Glu-tRNA(Gln) amidotransferase A subunit family amidase n=1 Tax=Nocardioides albertanoniae TaxID=1175486 RepID=A0A543A2W6_9ACTN|nr:amidase [Nocardioides albertanoniae]TQL66914.1 Asp-tRNA(Asn)/Glu-tRNA(Gln) amidotransferase A subunit family amidase [Nocardioides albertanoniae]